MPRIQFSEREGIQFKGDLCEIFHEGEHVGALFSWELDGVDGAWSAKAAKHRLSRDFGETPLEFRFINKGKDRRVELRGIGKFISDVIANGRTNREYVSLEGSQLRLWTGKPQ